MENLRDEFMSVPRIGPDWPCGAAPNPVLLGRRRKVEPAADLRPFSHARMKKAETPPRRSDHRKDGQAVGWYDTQLRRYFSLLGVAGMVLMVKSQPKQR
jgi:hypothetical protein